MTQGTGTHFQETCLEDRKTDLGWSDDGQARGVRVWKIEDGSYGVQLFDAALLGMDRHSIEAMFLVPLDDLCEQ